METQKEQPRFDRKEIEQKKRDKEKILSDKKTVKK
jgi:hypothetical protein